MPFIIRSYPGGGHCRDRPLLRVPRASRRPQEEFYLLLILATLGCFVLAAATHFASFFFGIELLSVSLYALAGYLRHSDRSVEAGVKYLILAAVSSAFILFGMALVYAETGSLAFGDIAAFAAGPGLTI